MMARRKSNVYDYNDSMLPKNRNEVFKDVWKLQWRKLMGLGMILFLFALPMQILWYLKEITFSSIFQAYANGELTAADASSSLVTISNQFALINIVFWLIIAIGVSGVVQILKRLSWAEPTHGIHDFLKGIRQNFKQYFIFFLIVGILSYIVNLISNFANLIDGQIVYEYLGAIPKVVLILIFLPVGLFALVNIAIYNNSFFNQIRLAFYIFICEIKRTYLSLIILLSPTLLLIVPIFAVQLIGRVLLILFIPTLLLKWILIVFDFLDKHWNVKHYPELVNKGVLGVEVEPNNDEEKNFLK